MRNCSAFIKHQTHPIMEAVDIWANLSPTSMVPRLSQSTHLLGWHAISFWLPQNWQEGSKERNSTKSQKVWRIQCVMSVIVVNRVYLYSSLKCAWQATTHWRDQLQQTRKYNYRKKSSPLTKIYLLRVSALYAKLMMVVSCICERSSCLGAHVDVHGDSKTMTRWTKLGVLSKSNCSSTPVSDSANTKIWSFKQSSGR